MIPLAYDPETKRMYLLTADEVLEELILPVIKAGVRTSVFINKSTTSDELSTMDEYGDRCVGVPRESSGPMTERELRRMRDELEGTPVVKVITAGDMKRSARFLLILLPLPGEGGEA